ncbi:hypothetical protein MESS4_600005 [Mesorhizobium sp. STM 4661]|nr:hypothetical protein MESS4_600005 [Mesorhizobium sp. STM 4661]
MPQIKEAIANGERFWAHLRICLRRERHRGPTSKAKHHWTNGQVERMYRTIKDATVKRFSTRAMISSGNTSPTSLPPTIRTQAQGPQARSNGLASRLRRPAPNWNSIGLEQFVSIRGSKTRTSGEVLDDFGTFFRAHDAMKG